MVEGETDLVSRWDTAVSAAVVLAAVGFGHVALFPNVADLDGFYHIGHALAYIERGIFDTSLPWATRSIISDLGADLWWGFHMLLLPFAFVGGVAGGMYLAALALTGLLAATVMVVLRRHGIAFSGVWAALLLLAVPNVFYRFLMVRPHILSLAGSIALLSVLVRGRWWQVLLVSAAVSWVHLSLAWLPIAVTLAYAVVRIPVHVFTERDSPDPGVPIRAALPAAVAGVVVGWLARPEAWATLELVNVQLLQLFTLKATGQPVTFSGELTPLGPLQLVRSAWLYLAVWVATVVGACTVTFRGGLTDLGRERATFLLATLGISTVFFVLTLVSARRALEQWVGFGFLAIPFLVAHLGGIERHLRSRPSLLTAAAAILLATHTGWSMRRHYLNVELVAFPASTMQEVSTFLSDRSDPNDQVFHARWDNFGPLFAYNRGNRYLSGMDPIFQYAHDPASYWEFFYLSSDVNTEWTCDAFPCTEGEPTDTHTVLQDHFGARWAVVEPSRNPRLTLFFLNDPRFQLVLETQHEAVFEVLERDGAP